MTKLLVVADRSPPRRHFNRTQHAIKHCFTDERLQQILWTRGCDERPETLMKLGKYAA